MIYVLTGFLLWVTLPFIKDVFGYNQTNTDVYNAYVKLQHKRKYG